MNTLIFQLNWQYEKNQYLLAYDCLWHENQHLVFLLYENKVHYYSRILHVS